MVDTDSLHAVLDSESDEDESSGSHSSFASVFVASAGNNDTPGAGGAETGTMEARTAEARANEELLRMPIPGDSPTLRALETQRQAILTESACLQQ